MLEVKKLTSENISSLQELYNNFKKIAREYYKFETQPLEFEQFKAGIQFKALKGYYAEFEGKPIGFLFYVLEEHKAIEINLIHIEEEFRGEEVELEMLEALLDDVKDDKDWIVISYPMLGGQAKFVHKMTHLGFKLIGQAIVRFSLSDTIAPQILTKLVLPSMPEGYSIDSWKPEYLNAAGEIIYESFHTAPDAKFDPRFRTPEGSKKVVKMLSESIIGDFLPACTSVLIHENKPVGICFGNLTAPEIGNIPLIGLMPSAQGKGLSLHLIKNTLTCFIRELIDGKIDCLEVNATVETDNFPALKMYRKVGFKEDYNYPHAYKENE